MSSTPSLRARARTGNTRIVERMYAPTITARLVHSRWFMRKPFATEPYHRQQHLFPVEIFPFVPEGCSRDSPGRISIDEFQTCDGFAPCLPTREPRPGRGSRVP